MGCVNRNPQGGSAQQRGRLSWCKVSESQAKSHRMIQADCIMSLGTGLESSAVKLDGMQDVGLGGARRSGRA